MAGSVIFFGSNELVNSDAYSMVTQSSVDALTGLLSVDVNIYRLGAGYLKDGENSVGGSDVMFNSGHVRRAYEIRTQGFHWENDFDDMDNLEKILSMRSCLLSITSHDLKTTLTCTDKCIALAENSEWEKEQIGNNRHYTIYVVNRKRSV